MDRCSDCYRREPGNCNFPAWKPTCHDFPQNAPRGSNADAFKRASRLHYGTIGLGGNNKTAFGEGLLLRVAIGRGVFFA
jgi:hypothetical protein